VIGQAVPLNAGDVESALAYWAEAATVALIGYPPTVRDSYNGREQVRGWLTELAAQHYQIQVKVIKVAGNAVTTRTEMWSDLIMQLDLAPLVATEVYVVNEGKIASVTSTIFPRSLPKFQSTLQAKQEGGGVFIRE
jgi:ketosteroid isomerase-like protein